MSSPNPANIGPLGAPEASKLGRTLYALLIGIDTYRTKPLRGCVKDAEDVEKYLVEDLKVYNGENQIRVLHNEKASRAGILQALVDLRMDARIKKGDPILIFYAGHGTEIEAPQGWEAGGQKIQTIIPHDFSEDAPVVHSIPDRTLSALIDMLAAEKGDNITVVFDSCHSGSGTRDDHREIRSMSIGSHLPADTDSDIIFQVEAAPSRAGNIAAGSDYKGLRSHMLISACGRSETAREIYFDLEKIHRGQFTVALLALFRREGLEKLTYTDIRSRLNPMTGQNPQIEGHNQGRLIFNSQGPAYGTPHYDLRVQDNRFMLDIGTIHGLSKGAQFTIYNDQNSFRSGLPLGVLEIAEDGDIKGHSTILSPLPGSPDIYVSQGIAVQTRAGERADLYIYLKSHSAETTDHVFDILLEQIQAAEPNRYRIVSTKDKASAQLAFEVEEESGMVVTEITDARVTTYQLTKISHSPIKLEQMHSLLRSAAHFYRHLAPVPTNIYIPSKITFEFLEVEYAEELDEDGNSLMRAVGPNLIKNDIIDIVVDRKKMYGMRVTNNTRWDLYPYAFLFSTRTLCISPYYMSPYGGKHRVDPPLPQGGTLTIGFGASGGVPYEFTLEDNQEIDVEFFKFFFSTQPTDMSNIEQGSPFTPSRIQRKPTRVTTYGVKVIPVVQRHS